VSFLRELDQQVAHANRTWEHDVGMVCAVGPEICVGPSICEDGGAESMRRTDPGGRVPSGTPELVAR
jgi:hypothetical protein